MFGLPTAPLGGSNDEPLTSLHANYWIRPLMPHPSTRTAEPLALSSPREVAHTPFQRHGPRPPAIPPAAQSTRCLFTGLSCLRSLAKRDASLFRAYQLDLGLFALFESIVSTLHWNQAPFLRFVTVPRELAK